MGETQISPKMVRNGQLYKHNVRGFDPICRRESSGIGRVKIAKSEMNPRPLGPCGPSNRGTSDGRSLFWLDRSASK